MIYALDSNIISYLLKDDATVYSQLIEAIDAGNRCIIPPIAKTY
jgi:predicted nucleic acid-binding protein